jgi:hypothetical protein
LYFEYLKSKEVFFLIANIYIYIYEKSIRESSENQEGTRSTIHQSPIISKVRQEKNKKKLQENKEAHRQQTRIP